MVNIEVCCKTDIGQKRSVNEDSLLDIKLGDIRVLAVADGLGGHAAGEVASRVAVMEMEEFLKVNLKEGNHKEVMKEAIAKANREIYLLSKENPAYAGMGSTLVAALFSQNKALIAWVGDSRAYLLGKEIRQITKDHSLVQELVDRKLITKEQAFDHPQKNIVTRALGLESEVYPDFCDVGASSGCFTLEEEFSGKIILLCSDGLSDSLRDEEILKTVTDANNLDEACSNLISLANKRGDSDNITVILAREAG